MGGLKGQARWPKGACTSLGPKPSLFFVFLFLFVLFSFPFLSLLLVEKPLLPLEKGNLGYFSVSPFVSP